MSDKSRLVIAAAVTANERAAVQSAADHLARVLGEASKTAWLCDVKFAEDLTALGTGEGNDIIITSLVSELDRLIEPWASVEARLRAAYAKLTESGTPIFICTVLRHSEDEPQLIRIRRLNFLAADLSRETGAYVIDVDRVLADLGARWLQTDCRLGGEQAAAVAGHLMAQTLLNNAIDAHVSFEVQEAAQTALEKSRPAAAQADGHRMEQKLQAVKKGRRTQTVIPVVVTDRDVAAGRLLDQALRGKLSLSEIYTRVRDALRNHGVKGTVVLVSSMVSRKLRKS